MEAMYETNQPVPLNTQPLLEELSGSYATGRTAISMKIRRASDNYVLDWGAGGGPTFVDPAGAVVQLVQSMLEFGASFPGEYAYTLDPTSITNLTDYDTYYVTVTDEASNSLIANLPQVGQFRVVPALDDATLSRKALYNNQTLQPGDTNNFVLKDDDGSTDLATWNVKDPSSLSVTIAAGAPAVRERTS